MHWIKRKISPGGDPGRRSLPQKYLTVTSHATRRRLGVVAEKPASKRPREAENSMTRLRRDAYHPGHLSASAEHCVISPEPACLAWPKSSAERVIGHFTWFLHYSEGANCS